MTGQIVDERQLYKSPIKQILIQDGNIKLIDITGRVDVYHWHRAMKE